jgi:site-specific DNA-cytosine methylase
MGLSGADGRYFGFVELLDGTVRRLTVEDVLALQGFPAGFRFPTDDRTRCWRAVGNAVPPPLAEAWARSIAAALPA